MKSILSAPVVFFDGYCIFCSRWARILRKIDRKKILRLVPTQSQEFEKIESNFTLATSSDQSVILYYNSKFYYKSDALFRICIHLGFPWNLFFVFRIIPLRILDNLYDWIARNRYRWFGKNDYCRLPEK